MPEELFIHGSVTWGFQGVALPDMVRYNGTSDKNIAHRSCDRPHATFFSLLLAEVASSEDEDGVSATC